MRGGLAQSVKGKEGGLGLYTSIEDVFDVEGNMGFTHAVLGERPNRVGCWMLLRWRCGSAD